jgi:hypothetical protein
VGRGSTAIHIYNSLMDMLRSMNDSQNWWCKQKEHVSTGGARSDAMTRRADAKDVVVVVELLSSLLNWHCGHAGLGGCE